ncbi:MAG: hypothetical protein L6R42_005545 [Xanthoria sp. 1 TBL-2021]|nr:MAG: hypothetical protein L6R42_005545 [Xanthoria sp. 1 TBL-2021]
MDPISVSASILGLLGAAAKISEVLTHFIKGVKDAPNLALRTLTEVEDLKICFRQLQHFINADEARRRSHATMVTVDQFVVVLTHAVMTFSELEVAVEGLRPRTASMINGRFKWITKENTISQLLLRLQASKTSLSLLLTTLTCTRLDEAQDATESLTDVVNGVLDTTQSIRQRLEQSNLPVQLKHQSAPSALENTMIPTEDDASTIRPARTTWASDAMTAVGRDSQLPQPNGKIALLGISNAGKSTIIKQLQSMQGIKSSHAEMEEARRMIIAQLFEVFQNTSHQDDDLQWDLLSKVSEWDLRLWSR